MPRMPISLLALLPLFFLAACTVSTTSRPVSPEAGPVEGDSYLHLSDIHLDLSGTSDDTDPQLWSITKAKLGEILGGSRPPRFVLYTGDLPGHYEGDTPPPSHDDDIRAVLADLGDLVSGTGIPLLYLPGNNDSLAGDYVSFTDSGGKTPLSLVPEDAYPAIGASRPCGSAPCISDPDPAMGYYSALPVPGLRIIALNSVILGRKYYPVDGISHRAAGDAHLTWFTKELEDAAAAGEKVLIAMHIPPGDDAYAVSHNKKETWMWARDPQGEAVAGQNSTATWLDRFLDLVEAHGDTVVGLAYGHTHMDELRRLKGRSGAVLEAAVSAPGITTNHGNNPGFKLVYYDSASFELTDFVTYYTQRGNTTWGSETYSFSAAFGCAGRTVLACLKSGRYPDAKAVAGVMDTFFTVKNGSPGYATDSGIDVERGQ